MHELRGTIFNYLWELLELQHKTWSPAGNYMFKVNNRNTRTRCEISSKPTVKTPERRQYLY